MTDRDTDPGDTDSINIGSEHAAGGVVHHWAGELGVCLRERANPGLPFEAGGVLVLPEGGRGAVLVV